MVNVKISDLTAATIVAAADVLPLVQGGVTKKTPLSLLPVSTAQAAADAAVQAAAIQRGNHTGTQSADTLTDGTTNKAYTGTERGKLAGIAAGATANRTDAAVDTLLTGKADLVAGVVPTAQIPALALTATVTVASQAAMLALTAAQVQPGDIAVRTDGAGTFILTATDPTVLGNWTRLNAPTDAVTTVNGQTGTVVLNAANVGADASGAAAAAVVGLAPLASPAFTGSPTIGGTAVARTSDVTAAVTAQASIDAATYLPGRGFGPRIAWLGDSITAGANDNINQSTGQSYPMIAQLLLGGKGLTVRNAGVQGETSAQMLARFDTDVTPYTPTVVALLAGTNDIGAGVTMASFAANVQAIVAKVRAINATPLLATIPPRSDSTAYVQPIATFNLWLIRYAATIGAPLIDLHAVLTDPATGGFKAGYSPDGVHPGTAAQQLMGQAAATVLTGYLRAWAPPLVRENTDTVQILSTNPLFVTDTNSDGIPDGYDHYGDANVTVSLVTDANVPGKMVRLTAAAATGIHIFENYIATGFAPGDTLAVGGVLTTDGGVDVQVKIDFAGSGKNAFPVNGRVTVTRGVFYREVVVPAGTTVLGVQVCSLAGTGYVQVGQLTVYNLTALGLA